MGSAARQDPKPLVVILSGDTLGYLSPCGCTQPMSGGIKRKTAAIKELTKGGSSLILENGGLVHKHDRQSEIKAETLAQSLKGIGVDAINLSSEDAQLGRGMMLSLANLSGENLISGSIEHNPDLPIWEGRVKDGICVGGATTRPERMATALGVQPIELRAAVKALLVWAEDAKAAPFLMLDGNEADARKLAEEFPALKLIQYRSTGTPSPTAETVNGVLLASPGDKARNILRLSYREGKFTDYAIVDLGPQFKDDPETARYYKTYLQRVGSENLLANYPRVDTPGFAGTTLCGSCHGAALKVWKKSEHSHALKTLELEGHDRDPDCVACHVVGLGSKKGFKSRKLTPKLSDVGCESCHGAGLKHSKSPYKVKMPKAGEGSCLPCHTSENSPEFDFAKYWVKVSHK